MTQNCYNFDWQLAGVEPPPQGEINMFGEWEDWIYGGNVKPDLSLLALPPPKRFLTTGSVYWVSPNVKYTFNEPSKEHKFGTYICVKKYHNIDDTKLRLLKTSYLFLRNKGIMSEIKSKFSSLVYNVEIKILYLRQFKSEYRHNKAGCITNKRRWVKSIIRLSINSAPLQMALSNFNVLHRNKFIEDLKRIVSRDIPDVCDICKNPINRITALILQHRVGKGLVNLNDTCMNNLATISRRGFIAARVLEIKRESSGDINYQNYDAQHHEKDIMKLKNNSLYKFVPTLKETGSLKKALKVVLGECYVGIYSKLLFDLDWNAISVGIETILIKYKKQVPKSIQHYVVQALKTSPMDDFKTLFREVLDVARTAHVQEHIKDAWVRTVKRLNKIIPWRIWADTYRMGGELGVRIRPNNFSNIQDVFTLHDRFSQIIRRNRDITNKYLRIGENEMFIKVAYPAEFEEYKFRQILTSKELVEESDYMGHCVHSYNTNCIQGHSIIFSVIDPESKRWTVEYSGVDYTFTQAEGNKADNNGQRYFCPGNLIQEIFAPFVLTLTRLNTYRTPYKMRCTLNLAIINVRKSLYGLDKFIDLDIPENTAQRMEFDIHNYNCVLEDLIHLNKQVIDKTSVVNWSPKINELLAKIANLNKLDKKEQSLVIERTQIRPVARPVARLVMQADAAELFPLIPIAVINEVQH